jgi:hypothetical protein
MRKWMRTTLKAWKKKAMSEMLDLETVERNLNAVSPILLRLDRRQYENRCASAPPLEEQSTSQGGGEMLARPRVTRIKLRTNLDF